MNKYKWDIKKLIDAKKKLNVNDFKSIEEFEEVSDLYNLLISTYIKDIFEEYIEYDDFNQLEYYEEVIKPYINRSAFEILSTLNNYLGENKLFINRGTTEKIRMSNDEVFELMNIIFKHIPNKNLYNAFISVSEPTKSLINIKYSKNIGQTYGTTYIDTHNHIPYATIYRENTTMDLTTTFHEIFHMIVRKNEESLFSYKPKTIYKETEGYFANLLLPDILTDIGLIKDYRKIQVNDLMTTRDALYGISSSKKFVSAADKGQNIKDLYIDDYLLDDMDIAFSYLTALDLYNMYQSNPEKVLDTILNLSSLSGSFPQQELEKIGATFHVDGCKNYKEHYEKVKKLNQ